ncbi:hypothetical protein [Priestia megaterium]|uniref:hypothetical protein n=1 Tax=Priestia megaterium TaxID=1404 RepID=UPI00390C9273
MNGENDWTPAIKQALKDLEINGGGELHLPHGIYYISNIVVPSNITLSLESAGVKYDGQLRQPSCLKRIDGSKGYAIIFKDYSKGKGIVLEGEEIGEGIKAENHVKLEDVSVFRTNGIGIDIGGVNMLNNIHSAYNNGKGIVFSKSDSILSQFYSYGNKGDGMYFGQGVANITVSNGKLEWNVSNNLTLDRSNNIFFSNVIIDRSGLYGIYINGPAKAFFSNTRLWRSYSKTANNEQGKAHIFLNGTNSRLYLSNFTMQSGTNDDSKGQESPDYGITGWSQGSKIYVSNFDYEKGFMKSLFSPYSGASITIEN